LAAQRFCLSARDRKIAGVCGGIAQYFDIDPTFVRVVFVALAFSSWGIILYLIFWLVAPRERTAETQAG